MDTSRTALGEAETVRLSNGTTLVRSYDASGQLVGLRSADGQFDALLSYDVAGHAHGITAQLGGPSGVALGRVYEHDDRGLLRQQRTQVGSLGLVSDVSYAYAPDGNPIARVDAVRGDQNTWTYDGADRLVAASDRDGASGVIRWHLYAYHDNGALLKAIGDGTTTTYVYRDSTESLLGSMQHSPSTGSLATSYTTSSTGSRCSASGTDAFGQPLAYRYAWYADGRLAEMVRGGAAPSTLRFDYDARGALWRTSDSERGTTLQLGDGFEARVGGGYRVSVALPGMRCVLPGGFQAATCSFSDTNGVSLTYNAAGALVDARAYEPYGREIRTAGPGPVPPWGYEEKRRHDHGRLLDFGARPYDPLARQFLSVDPLRLDGAGDVLASDPAGPASTNTLQPFVYAAANPIANWDPDGRFPWKAVAKWTGVGALLAVAVVATVATAGAAAPLLEGATLTTVQLITVEIGMNVVLSSVGGAIGLAGVEVGPTAIEATDGRSMRKLSDGEIRDLKDAGYDIHDLKRGVGPVSQSDLYKDQRGNVYRLPRGGRGEPEPVNVNLGDL